MHDDDVDSGLLEVVNHKHYDYASTALTLVKLTNTTRPNGEEKEKEMLDFVYILMVCGADFSVSLQLKKETCKFILQLLHNFTFALTWNYIYTLSYILRPHKCGILDTRFHIFYIHINVELYKNDFIHLYGVEK